MQPYKFPESNEAVIENGTLEIPFYQDSMRTVCCYQLTKEELDVLNKTGKLWLTYHTVIVDPWMKLARPSVYNPFVKLQPIQLDESIVDKVIIHYEDGEELILFRMEPGFMLNVATMFSEKMKVVGHGIELKQYGHVLDQYKLDPAWTYILKRVRNQ
jgi:hypothetical protein